MKYKCPRNTQIFLINNNLICVCVSQVLSNYFMATIQWGKSWSLQ